MISAKSLSGTVYSYAVVTAGEFKTKLFLEKQIPTKMIKFLSIETGELEDEAELSPEITYSLFLEYGDGLREWIPLEKLDRTSLSMNSAAAHLLEDSGHLNWYQRSANQGSIRLLRVLEQNPRREFPATNLCYEDWRRLSSNPEAIHLLERYPEKINWTCLSANPAAIHLLEKYPENINWEMLSCNPAAIRLLENDLEKVNWKRLNENPAALHLLERHRDKIDWWRIGKNPAIFYPRYEL